MRWSGENRRPETVDCSGIRENRRVVASVPGTHLGCPGKRLGQKFLPIRPARLGLPASTGLKVVCWTSSSTAPNASSRVHSDLLPQKLRERGPQAVGLVASLWPLRRRGRWRPAVLRCPWGGRRPFAVLAGDVVFLSPLDVSLSVLGVSLVFMGTVFHAN